MEKPERDLEVGLIYEVGSEHYEFHPCKICPLEIEKPLPFIFTPKTEKNYMNSLPAFSHNKSSFYFNIPL